MATRFPGVDPFLEGQRWEGFSEADAAWVGRVLELGS
jgi:hypothetical protein